MASSSDFELIKTIPDDHARTILLHLCRESRIRRKVVSYATDLQMAPPRKRKAETSIAICVRCDEVFDSDDNKSEDCCYHDGELEPDFEGDFWADHDENCHGTIDTDEMREEFPDGFVWTCCDDTGSSPGCKYGHHESQSDQ